MRRLRRAALGAGFALLLAQPELVRADDDAAGELRPPKPAAAQLNAFGCEGLEGATFAGRYESIDVFANTDTLLRKPSVAAFVVGQLVPQLMPPMLRGAMVEWVLAREGNDSWLLYGTAVRPDGAELLVRLLLPKTSGVYEVTLRTDNLSTGEHFAETIVCSVR